MIALLVGGWVGGPASYLDQVEVTGVIQEGTTRRGPASISEIEMITLYRDNDVYVVSGGAE